MNGTFVWRSPAFAQRMESGSFLPGVTPWLRGYWLVDDAQKAEAYLNTEVSPRIEELVKIDKSFSGLRRTKEWKHDLMILG